MGMSGCSGAGAPAPMAQTTQVAGQSSAAPAPGKVEGGGGFSLDQAKLAPILAELTKVIQQISTLVAGTSGSGPGQGDPTQTAPGKTSGGGPNGAGMDIAAKMLADLDADRNGQVNKADVTQHATTGSQFAYLAAAAISLSNRAPLDQAGLANLTQAFRHADGTVDKASFQSGLLAKGQELLARFDANRDGKLDTTESTALTSSL